MEKTDLQRPFSLWYLLEIKLKYEFHSVGISIIPKTNAIFLFSTWVQQWWTKRLIVARVRSYMIFLLTNLACICNLRFVILIVIIYEMLRDDLTVVACLPLSAIVKMTPVFTQDSHKSCFHSNQLFYIYSVNVVI